jgi:hypothetical protein
MDCAQMDTPDLYGNTHFLVIVDRATSYLWTIPLKTKVDLHVIVEKFIQTVVIPYHSHCTHKAPREKSLAKIGLSKPSLAKEKLTESTVLKRMKQEENYENLTRGLRKICCDRGTEFYNQDMTALAEKYSCTIDAVPP